MGKVVKKIAKPISKIIPKEIRPALPFIVPFIPGIGPALAGGLQSLGVSAKIAPLLARGIISSGTTALSDPNAKGSDILRSGVLSVAPQAISQGLGSLEQAGKLPEFMTKVGEGKDAVSALQKIQSSLQPETLLGKAGMVATQTGLQQAPIVARMNEQALRDYEAQLREQGIMDSAERRNKIFGYFTNAGYSADETNSFLDKYGYASGGRVGFKKGGGIQALIDYLKEKEDEDEEFNLGKFSTGLEGIKSGYEIATGQPLMGMKPQPTRFGLADGGVSMTDEGRSGVIYRDEEGNPISKEEFLRRTDEEEFRDNKAKGGIMNLGGREMDMRGGGFIPIGQRERADDVPARLSKNEFVMTADAVRAAGGGSIEKGAKRMYDLMNRLEAKA